MKRTGWDWSWNKFTEIKAKVEAKNMTEVKDKETT